MGQRGKYKKYIEVERNAPIYAQRIAELLNEKEMSQKDLAQKSQVSEASITAWLTKNVEPKIESINAVAKVLNVSLDYLMGNTNVKSFDTNIQAINNYTGLTENAINLLKESNSYKIGDPLQYPAENGNVMGMVTCEYDMPIYTVNLLLENPKILRLIQLYLTHINEETGFYTGDGSTTILFELMHVLRELRDLLQPVYKKEFYAYMEKRLITDENE